MRAKDIQIGEVYEVEPYKYEVAAMRIERVERDKQRWDGWRYIPNREGEGTLRAYGQLLSTKTLEPLPDSQQRYTVNGRGLTLKQVIEPWDAAKHERARQQVANREETRRRDAETAIRIVNALADKGVGASYNNLNSAPHLTIFPSSFLMLERLLGIEQAEE